MKKIIILIISIIIPLIGALFVGLYATNIRYQPETNTTIASKFRADLNEGAITSPTRIEKYREFENYYYDEEPIFLQTLKNDVGSNMMTLAIYRSYYFYQPSADVESQKKIKFEVFVYDINYNLIKDYFTLDDQSVIDKAPLPTLKITLTPTNGKDPLTVTLTNRSDVMIPDYNAVPEWANEAESTRNYVQSYMFRVTQETALKSFSKDVNITIDATLSITGADSTTTTIAADEPIAKVYVEDFESNFDKVDTSNYKKGFRESSVLGTYKNAGYYKWLFLNYIWWECLIAIALIGFVTVTFYFVWTAEDQATKVKTKKKK